MMLPEEMGPMPWLTIWRGSSLDLEVSWSSAVVHSSQWVYVMSCMVSTARSVAFCDAVHA